MRSKVLFLVLGLLVLAGLMARPAHAADVRRGERVVIAADEIVDDDLIVSAQYVEVNGTVTGDLVATGTVIVVNGTVGGSALLAAQTLEVRGRVGGSVYGAAYSLLLDEGAAVSRNVLFGGFSATTRPDSQIDRDLYVAGYQLLHDGVVGGDLNVAGNALQINGSVGGDVTGEVTTTGRSTPRMLNLPNVPADIEVLPSGVVVGPTAQIAGQMLVQETAVDAGQAQRGVFGLPRRVSNRLGQTFGLLLVAIVAIALAPRLLPGLSNALQSKPLPSLGWGALIYLLLFPLGLIVGLALIVLLTLLFAVITFGQYTAAILGLTIGAYVFALFAFLFFVYIMAWLVVGHLLGRLVLGQARTALPSRGAQFAYVLLGVLVFQGLRIVPVLDFVLAFFVGTFVLGAAFVWWLNRRPAKVAVVQP